MKFKLTLILLICHLAANAQKIEIEGKVRIVNSNAENKISIVLIKDGKMLDSNIVSSYSNYKFGIEKGEYSFLFRSRGYEPITVNGIRIINNTKGLNFGLNMTRARMAPPVAKIKLDTVTKTSVAMFDTTYTTYVTIGKKVKTKTKYNRSAAATVTETVYYDAPTSEFEIGKKDKEDRKVVVTPPFMHRESDAAKGTVTEWSDYESSTTAYSGDIAATNYSAGQLTAGHWRDLDNWEEWKKTNNESKISQYMKIWGFYPKEQRVVHLQDRDGKPAKYIAAQLKDSDGTVLWSCLSDEKGDLYLWPGLFADTFEHKDMKLELHTEAGIMNVDNIDKYINTSKHIVVNSASKSSNSLEVAWMVDATGSMGDEIKYLQSELIDVIGRIKMERPCADIRTGAVFYRDFGDEYVTKVSSLDGNMMNTIDFINQQSAMGGGDMPEAVEEGLAASIDQLGWSETKGAKILFLLLDAPAHGNKKEQVEKIRKYTMKAASMGVRLIPIAASGITKDAEFLCKYMAIATNGEYIYITNDSKIGNDHINPTGGESQVELLNNLLVKTILKYSDITCPEQIQDPNINPQLQNLTQEQIDSLKQNEQNQEIFANQDWNMRFYPNPANIYLFIQLSASADNISISTLNGQTVYKEEQGTNEINLNISSWSSGIYIVRATKGKETLTGKLIIVH